MPIITISRGSYFHGKSIAEKLAQRLDYKCISRDEVIDGLEEFHLPEIKLVRGLNDAFRVLERFPNGKTRYASAIRAALFRQFMKGNVIYHGLVGHHFVRSISHVLKVRIIADTERRIEREMARENIAAKEARYILKKDDEERRQWCMFLYGVDIVGAAPYNLVLRIGHLSEDDAVDIIAKAATVPTFQETAESRSALANEALAAIVQDTLFDHPHARVSAEDGHVRVALKAPVGQSDFIKARINETLGQIEGVRKSTILIEPYY